MAHMEEVLDLYEEPYDPRRPVVFFAGYAGFQDTLIAIVIQLSHAALTTLGPCGT